MSLVGTMLGRYRLDRLLGEGATSQVYLATHTQLERKVAIKVLAERFATDREGLDRVVQEARVVNSVRHPNIAEVFDLVEGEKLALVMEYVEGPNLGALEGTALSVEQAIGASLQLVSAMQATHEAGVIHRDLKPDNLLFTRDPRECKPSEVPRLKIIDFGIAKLGSQGNTVAGKMIGTPSFMAPEQIAGTPRTNPATDVFAIGLVIYQMLTGERAYTQSTVQEVVRAKLRGPKPELAGLERLPGHVHRALGPILHRCLATAQADRPALAEIWQALYGLVPAAESDPLVKVAFEEEDEDLSATVPVEIRPPSAPRPVRSLARANLPPPAATGAELAGAPVDETESDSTRPMEVPDVKTAPVEIPRFSDPAPQLVDLAAALLQPLAYSASNVDDANDILRNPTVFGPIDLRAPRLDSNAPRLPAVELPPVVLPAAPAPLQKHGGLIFMLFGIGAVSLALIYALS